jgi:hypothetical protein
MKDVKPFFVPPATAIRPGPWRREIDGEWEPLPDHLDDWDQSTRLRLACTIDVDIDTVRATTHLDPSTPLVWACGWRTTDAGLVGPPVLTPFADPDFDVELVVPPDRAGTSIVLTRRLLLLEQRTDARPGQAHHAGSVLWDDETPLQLTGSGAAFPTEIVDFIGHTPGGQAASWYLDLPASVDNPAMGSMMLEINAADVDLIAAVTRGRRHTDHQRVLLEQMEEGVVEELVRWALARWDDLEDTEPASVGEMARVLTSRILPDPAAWSTPDADSMALKAAITVGARTLGFGRQLP